jgi:3-oxoacyl-[acyl-carrier protein] reductase
MTVRDDWFRDRRYLVTGASRGIGRALATALAARGAEVVLAARTTAQLEELASLIQRDGGRAWPLPLDLREPDRLEERLTPLLEQGGVDALLSNAAVSRLGLLEYEPWEEMSTLLTTNVLAPIRLTQLLLPSMLERGRGLLAYFSSIAVMGMPSMTVYGASKGAMYTFSRCLRNELKGAGPRVVHCVVGGVDTEMRDQMREFMMDNLERFRFTMVVPYISADEFALRFLAALEGPDDEIGIGDIDELMELWSVGGIDEAFEQHYDRLV